MAKQRVFIFKLTCFIALAIYVVLKLDPVEHILDKFDVIDFDYSRVMFPPKLENLDVNSHVSQLISSFKCNNEHLKVLILVTSNVSSFDRRMNVRLSWGKTRKSHTNNDFRTFFVVGKSTDANTMIQLGEEITKYNDIIQGNYYESFYHLPYKVETIFEYAYKHCSYDYLLKGDDDVFINLSIIFQMINQSEIPTENVYLGLKHSHAKVYRDGKYEIRYEKYAARHYPDFCGGGAVIFSPDVVKNMIPFFQNFPFQLDDVYIGILVMNAGVEAQFDERFRQLRGTTCTYVNTSAALHSPNHTKKRSCMWSLFYTMITSNLDNWFVKRHYIGNL